MKKKYEGRPKSIEGQWETLNGDGEASKDHGEALKIDGKALKCDVKLTGCSGQWRGVKGQKKGLQLQRRSIKLEATKTHYCLPSAPLHSPIMPLSHFITPQLLCNASCGPLTPPRFFAQNPTKKVFYTCSSCICWKSYSPLLDLEIDILTLKMTFYELFPFLGMEGF